MELQGSQVWTKTEQALECAAEKLQWTMQYKSTDYLFFRSPHPRSQAILNPAKKQNSPTIACDT